MYGDVLRHETNARRFSTAIMGLSLGAVAFFGLAVSGSLGAALDELTKGLPDALKAFVGGDVPGGYVVGEVFTLVTPIALVTYGILSRASALACEERDGTMSLLSAQSVTRIRMLLAKATSLLLSLIVVAALFWAGMTIAAVAFGSALTAGLLAAGATHLLFLSLAFTALALAIGAATGSPGLASGVAGGFAVLSYLSSAMLPLAGLGGWARLSPWHYALSSDPLRNGIDVPHLGVFVAIIIVSMVAGMLLFDRRDLKG